METLSKTSKQKTTAMLCAVICGPSLNEAREQVRKSSSRVDMVEFRIDQFEFDQVEAIAHLKEASSVPVIFTLRKRSHGGEYRGDEEERLDDIRKLLEIKPEYLDLEYDVDYAFYEEVNLISSETSLISSFHDFEQTPKDLQSIFDYMKHLPATIYKFSTMANSSLDALRMLRLVKENVKKGYAISGVCMGEYGSSTRIMGPVVGSAITFSAINRELATAPGQITVNELINQYHFKKLNRETSLLGLIGDPVNKSPSHHTHNHAIRSLGLNAVYVKFNVLQHELKEFLDLAKKLNFMGFSVTMPLKGSVIAELSEASDDAVNIGAINSIQFNQKKMFGCNTDGKGALDALEEYESVQGKTVIVLGAGGAAKAISWEAIKRGAKVVILNRTQEKAEELAQHLGCECGSLNDFSHFASLGYDFLVNSTSVGLYSEKSRLAIDLSSLLPEKVVLDVIPSFEDTAFLHEARNKKCRIVFGNEMLMNQAIEQFIYWFGNEVDREDVKKSFNEAFHSFESL
ncbi:MAG: shikimate dehydrogenase [Chlamydiota bacterium]|nr:shikimate dehydrogenase [Chlamydiota bacterium]